MSARGGTPVHSFSEPTGSEHQVGKSTRADPPSLPANYIYTKYYCEENVYFLCRDFLEREDVCKRWDIWVIFISNESRSVALRSQKAAREQYKPVVWDYHVILVLEPNQSLKASDPTGERTRSWVYDLDSMITPMPCTWLEYTTRTFSAQLIPSLQSMFRLIPGHVFLNEFASDRSHMLNKSQDSGSEPTYWAPPPDYEPICGELAREAGVTHNILERFVAMDGGGEEAVVSLGEVLGRF